MIEPVDHGPVESWSNEALSIRLQWEQERYAELRGRAEAARANVERYDREVRHRQLVTQTWDGPVPKIGPRWTL